MITRFFSTSKPIHFVIIILTTLITLLFTRISNYKGSLNLIFVLEQLGLFIVVLISFFILDFLVSKNNLTKKSSYKILMFGLLLVLLPITFQINNVLISNVFILFALRRIISLRTNLNVKKKLFDAAFWIGIASLFYFWSILFFTLIIAALIVYSLASVKNWIIPLIGLSTVAAITISYLIMMPVQIELSNYLDVVSFDFTKYNRLNLIIGITILMSLGIWTLFFYMKNLKDKIKRQRRSHVLIIVSVLIGMIIILIAPNKNGSEFIFLFAPLSVIMANYLESLKKHWFAELFIWILILTPIFFLWI
jgi:hypothetical protein